MPKIQRKTQKVFCNSADSDQLAVFGSMSTGTPVYTSDVEELQSNEAFDLGWDAATLEDKAPFMEEMNGVQYGLTYQIAYGLQEGIPEYDSATTYYIGSICKVLEDGKPVLYTSLTDDNIGNDPVNDSTNWERLSFGGGGLEIGDIGIAPLGIDETKGKRRYLNGQLIIQEQYVQFTDKVKSAIALYPSLACTESEWQTTTTMTVGGQVGKFVVDDNAGTIRLPKIIMPIQGLTDLSKLGEIVEAGLPNIEGAVRLAGMSNTYKTIRGASGAFTYSAEESTSADSHQLQQTEGNYGQDFYLDASKSSSIYGSSNTVQQEQIQYPYFIQVATGAETEDNITNTIELNNPFSLLDYKYSEYELNNLSWLRSEGQYNSKAIYPAVYDLLLKIYNGVETKAGVSVKLTTETFTDYDFVLNTADETFRLPVKVKLASGKAVVGNGMSLGLTDGTRFTGIGLAGDGGTLGNSFSAYGANVGSATFSTGYGNLTQTVAGLTTDPTKSGIETSDSDLYLYFYVGETVQNANLINAGRIEEKLHSMIPDNSSVIAGYAMPSNKYIDLTLGASGTEYTAPANGWVVLSKSASSTGQYIHLKCSVVESAIYAGSNGSNLITYIPVLKSANFKCNYNAGGNTNSFRFVYAEGEQ